LQRQLRFEEERISWNQRLAVLLKRNSNGKADSVFAHFCTLDQCSERIRARFLRAKTCAPLCRRFKGRLYLRDIEIEVQILNKRRSVLENVGQRNREVCSISVAGIRDPWAVCPAAPFSKLRET
jgi:hypothetical protein